MSARSAALRFPLTGLAATGLAATGRSLCRRLLLLLTLAMASVTLAGVATAAPLPSPLYPPRPNPATLVVPALATDPCSLFAGSGFAPGSQVSLFDRDTRVDAVLAGPDGSFAKRLCFNSAAKCGSHHLIAKGIQADGAPRQATTYVTLLCTTQVVAKKQLPGTQWLLIGVALGSTAVLTLLLGRGLVGLRRRRSDDLGLSTGLAAAGDPSAPLTP